MMAIGKAPFSASLQCHTILQKSVCNHCWYDAPKILLSNVGSFMCVCVCFQDSLMHTISKVQHLFEIESFCNIMNVFTVPLLYLI